MHSFFFNLIPDQKRSYGSCGICRAHTKCVRGLDGFKHGLPPPALKRFRLLPPILRPSTPNTKLSGGQTSSSLAKWEPCSWQGLTMSFTTVQYQRGCVAFSKKSEPLLAGHDSLAILSLALRVHLCTFLEFSHAVTQSCFSRCLGFVISNLRQLYVTHNVYRVPFHRLCVCS
jgi:hypothetical protein